MKRILSEIAAVYSLFLIPAMAANATPSFRIVYFPEAAYINERVTFIVEGKPGSKLNVLLDDKQIIERAFDESILELNFTLKEPGLLRLQQDSTAIAFRAVQPVDKAALTEEDGYLYCEGMPAVLLAQHRIPSKHDRRWETLKFLGRLFGDKRTIVNTGVMLNAGIPSEWKAPELDKATDVSEKFWLPVDEGSCSEGINRLVATADRLQSADIAVIVLGGADYEHGADDLQFRIKLEWYLQALEKKNIKQVFVVSALDSYQRQRFSNMINQVALAASENNAIVVITERNGASDAASCESWLKTVMNEIDKVVKCR